MMTSIQSDHNYSDHDWQKIAKPLEELKNCSICPRECQVDRIAGEPGFCRTGADFAIASISAHKGEEPPISGENGICNIFFAHCNMQCIYCQNHQISDNGSPLPEKRNDLSEVIQRIEAILSSGVCRVGFVSSSHFIPQMKAIINILKARRRDAVFVFNTNAYDKEETIRGLEGLIDVYLPDLKYMDNHLAVTYSNTPNYVQIATTAVKEMFRQKGDGIRLGDKGDIQSGLIVRHLVLPGEVENSKKVLRFIAEELSPSVYVSLMAQYYPTPKVKDHPHLGRTITAQEYGEVLEELENLGLHRGWLQNIDSSDHYRPDFSKQEPFGND